MNLNMADNAEQRWNNIRLCLVERRRYTFSFTDTDHLSYQAVIAQKDYVCYLAQERAGARK